MPNLLLKLIDSNTKEMIMRPIAYKAMLRFLKGFELGMQYQYKDDYGLD